MITAAAPANIAFWVEGAPAAPFNNSDAAGRCKIERSVVVTSNGLHPNMLHVCWRRQGTG